MVLQRSFHQLLPSFAPRDAIGTEATILRDFFRGLGFRSEIYCRDGVLHDGAKSSSRLATDLENEKNAITLFHFSIGTDLANLWPHLRSERWLRYHNITPVSFFPELSEVITRHLCGLGRLQLPQVACKSDVILSASNYNSDELRRFGFGEIRVIPVLRDYHSLVNGRVDKNFLDTIADKSVATVLFVGRVARNKSHHDILQILALHKKISNRRVRVVFAGGYFSASYQKMIADFARALGLKLAHHWDPEADILSLGSITNEQLAALYKAASLYASMSEHEGFGVPIVESMFFDLPVYAHAAAAVPEILGQGHFLVNKFDWVNALEVFEQALFDETTRAKEIERTKTWRRRFELEGAKKMFLELLQ